MVVILLNELVFQVLVGVEALELVFLLVEKVCLAVNTHFPGSHYF